MSTKYRKDVTAEEIRIAKVFKHILIKWSRTEPEWHECGEVVRVPKIILKTGLQADAQLPRYYLSGNGWVLKSLRPVEEVIAIKKNDFKSICRYIKPKVGENVVIKTLFKMGLIAVYGSILDFKFRFSDNNNREYYLLDARRMSPEAAIGKRRNTQ